MSSPLFKIIYEDEQLLIINKEAGLVCHPTKGDALSSLVGRIRLHGSQITARLINRLDRETSGLVVVAKTVSTSSALGRLWEQHLVEKKYWAVVHGLPPQEDGVIDVPLGRDLNSMVAIKDCVRMDGALAQTEYRVLRSGMCAGHRFSLLEIVPRTGRKHQIRIHLAHIGHPIVGDKLYGGDELLYLSFVKGELSAEQRERLILPNHALHAKEIRFPWMDRLWEFCAEPDVSFSEFVRGLQTDKDRDADCTKQEV